MRSVNLFIVVAFALCTSLLGSCDNSSLPNDGETAAIKPEATWDLDQIVESGELVAATLSGPDTYYEYQGSWYGTQYRLAEKFAQHMGLRLRVEVARDTASLAMLLENGDADLIICELPMSYIEKNGLMSAGNFSTDADTGSKRSWAVNAESQQLSEALQKWYSPQLKNNLLRALSNRRTATPPRKNVRAPYLSKEKGIISPYDAHFAQYGRQIGWDWRLLAAQCYQESGFDPEAVSWTGAKGLMQIMPKTASILGLPEDRLFDPEANIEAAARYIKQLQGRFADIPGRQDRICFVLAAYNGGYHHIRDAMSLAEKNKKDARRWENVAPYVLKLAQPAYYNDPVVKYGYMVGTETYNYVTSIMTRWNQYRDNRSSGNYSSAPSRSTKRNRFTKGVQILSPEEMLQQADTTSHAN